MSLDLSLNGDGNLSFCLTTGKRKFPSTMLLPDVPDGEFSLIHGTLSFPLGYCNLTKARLQVMISWNWDEEA